MEKHSFGRSSAALLLLAAAGCTAPHSGTVALPHDGPLPPGMYELTAHVTYRDDTPQELHVTHASYGSTLYVTYDGKTVLYDGNRACTDYADLPAETHGPEERPIPGHSFRCGDRSWYLWVDGGRIVGRVSAGVNEMVQSRNHCLQWSFDGGRQTCRQWGVQVDPRWATVSGDVEARKISQ
jgi:hypothetical protein